MATPMSSQTPFDWTDEHREIRAMVRKKFASLDGPARARRALDAVSDADDADDAGGSDAGDASSLNAENLRLWRELCAELGLAGLTLPEQYGGAGCGRIELAILAEEMGRCLMGGPYLSSVVMAAEALLVSGDGEAAEEFLPSIAEGGLVLAFAAAESSLAWAAPERTVFSGGTLTGQKNAVVGLGEADAVLVTARDEAGAESLYLVDVAAAHIAATPGIDATRTVGSVVFDAAPARLIGARGDGESIRERVRESAAIFLAAEQAGGSRACVDLSAEYARTRIQFGQPIGRFQGVKHRLADMEVRTAQAHSAAVWAAWQEPGSPEARLGADVARAWCSPAFTQTAFDTIQIHGGIGITWEHDAHLFVRRAQADAALLGPVSIEHERLAAQLGQDA